MAKLTANTEIDYMKFNLQNAVPRHLNWVVKDILAMSSNIVSTEASGLRYDEMLYNICYLAHMLRQESLDASEGWVEMNDMRFTYIKDARRGTSPVTLAEVGALEDFIAEHFRGYGDLTDEERKERVYDGVDKIQHFITNRDSYTLEGVVPAEDAESDISADDKPKTKVKAPVPAKVKSGKTRKRKKTTQ